MRDCLADVAKGQVVIVPGLQYKVLTTGGRMVPRNLVRAMTKVVGRGRGGRNLSARTRRGAAGPRRRCRPRRLFERRRRRARTPPRARKIGESLAVLGWNVSVSNLRFDGDYVLIDVDASPSQPGGQHAKADSLRFGLYGALAHPIEANALGSCADVTSLSLQPAVCADPRQALRHSVFGAAARSDPGARGVRVLAAGPDPRHHRRLRGVVPGRADCPPTTTTPAWC